MPKYKVVLKPLITITTTIDTDDLDGEANDEDTLRDWIQTNLDSVSDFADIIEGNSAFECETDPDVTLTKVEIAEVKDEATTEG